MKYERYTQKDADKDGIEYAISEYSTKCIDNGKIIGIVVFTNNEIVINNDYIKSVNNKEAELYYCNPLAELTECILNSSNRVVVTLVDILQDCKSTNLSYNSCKQSFCFFGIISY